MPTATRPAFARPDALVAGLLAALAAGLIVPVVVKAREADARVKCTDNLRQLGEAFRKFESARNGFPARRIGFQTGKVKGGWGVLLLPYLGDGTAARAYRADYDYFDPVNKAVVETPLPPFRCPASPARTVAVESNASDGSANPDKDKLFTVAAATNDYIASNGFFMPRAGYGLNWPVAGLGNDRQPMQDDAFLPAARVTDGLSNTLMLIEQAGRPQIWRLGKRVDTAKPEIVGNLSRGSWAGFGSIAFGPFDPADGFSPAKGDGRDLCVNANNNFGIYGFHDGGANVLFCDGSVRFVGRTLGGLTFARIATRDDGQMVSPDDF